MVTRHLRPLAPLLLATGVCHAATGWLFVDTGLSEDSDRARQQSYFAGYRHALSAGRKPDSLSLAAGYRAIDDSAGQTHFKGLRTEWRMRTEAVDTDVQLQALSGADWSPVLGAARVAYRPTDRWYLEAAAERELVDTVTAVALRNQVDTYSLSADYRVFGEWTVVGAGFVQDFRDGNRRLGRTLKLIYSPAAVEGFNVQVRGRRVDAEFRGVGYFSPDRLDEYDLGVGYARAVFNEQWSLGGRLAYGTQRVDTNEREPLYSAELRARGHFAESLGLESRLGCTSTGEVSARQSTSGYRYCFAHIGLTKSL